MNRKQIEKAKELYENGMKKAEIAHILGLTPSQIKYVLPIHRRIPDEEMREMYAEGVSIKEIAKIARNAECNVVRKLGTKRVGLLELDLREKAIECIFNPAIIFRKRGKKFSYPSDCSEQPSKCPGPDPLPEKSPSGPEKIRGIHCKPATPGCG